MSDITRSYPTNIAAGGDTTSTVLKAHDPEIVKIYEWLTKLRNRQPSTASTRPANPNTYDVTYDTAEGVNYMWNGSAWVAQTVSTLNVPLRQTVLSGPFNATTGAPELITTNTAQLTVQLYATSTYPVIVSFMDGFDTNGAKDIIAQQASAVATFWTGLTQNTTNYLYINYSAGVLSGGYSVIAPVYSFVPPSHTSGKHWINMNTGLVQLSNGSTWSKVNRVFVAECTTDPYGVINSVIYPYNDSLITKQIRAITGKTNWYDTPDTTIASLNTRVGALETIPTSAQTDNYTLVLSDAGKLIEMNKSTAVTLTVPPNSSVSFAAGTKIDILQTGAGQVTVAAGSGVTINGQPGLKLSAQWAGATLVKRATDTWVLIGSLSA